MVMSLDNIPGALSRSSWVIFIDGKVLRDWVMANFWWHSSESGDSEGYLVVEIGAPLKYPEGAKRFAALMSEPGGHLIQLKYQAEFTSKNTELPEFTISDARATLYKLLPMQSQGTELEGLDARSDWPVIQAITFNAKLEKGVNPVGLADSKDD